MDSEEEKEEQENEIKDGKFSNQYYIASDRLIKEKIDKKKIKKIDWTKKRAVTEGVFDERTYFQLKKILESDFLDSIQGIISSGKEANIYLGYDKNQKEIALKVYKIDSNTSKWMRNYIIGDPRFKKIPKNTAKIIYLWASKEYKNLKRAYKVKLNVPQPLYVKKNILLMEFIGFGPIPAPKLKDITRPTNLEVVLNEVLEFIKRLYQKAQLVHGDLSEFNILYHNQKPVIIDISQAVSIQHPKAEKLLVRDIKNIFKYFDKFNIELQDPEKFYYDIIGMK